MNTETKMLVGRGLLALIALAAVWEILSPFLLGFSDQAIITQNCVIVGIFILLFSALGGITGNPNVGRWSDMLTFVLGIWLIVTPFLLGFTYMNMTAMISSWATGAVITLASAASFIGLPASSQPTL